MINLTIQRQGVFGEGIAKVDNKTVFVDYALVGENVDADIYKESKDIAFAKITKINTISENRVEPQCGCYQSCGGCTLMHTTYQNQLNIKKQNVLFNLKKIANLQMEDCEVFASDNQLNYRNHATFQVSQDGVLGFYAKSSNNFIAISKCHIMQEEINKCISIFNSYFYDNQIKGFNGKSGQVKNVDIKFAGGKLLVTIFANIKKMPNIENLIIRLNCLKVQFGIYVSYNKNLSNHYYSGNLIHIYGIHNLQVERFGIKSFVLPFSFFQVNENVESKLYNYVMQNAKGNNCLDCYCGRGVLSAYLATKFENVEGYEIEKTSVLDAQKLIEQNNIKNLNIKNGDCAYLLSDVVRDFDCVVLDPPRKGVDSSVIMQLQKMLPNQIIYVSCNSATLARDLKLLMQAQNYSIEKLAVFDMFCQTSNIETIAVLKKM